MCTLLFVVRLSLGEMLASRGEHAEARAALEEALPLLRRSGDVFEVVETLRRSVALLGVRVLRMLVELAQRPAVVPLGLTSALAIAGGEFPVPLFGCPHPHGHRRNARLACRLDPMATILEHDRPTIKGTLDARLGIAEKTRMSLGEVSSVFARRPTK